MSELTTITEFRKERGETLAEFAVIVGIKSAGHMSDIERAGRCSADVALAIESLSDFRIDAADLCDDVRKSRQGHSRLAAIASRTHTEGAA